MLNARDRRRAERREKVEQAEDPTLWNRLRQWWDKLLEDAGKK